MTRRVVLNIRGVNYETYEETLSRFPNTLLGNSTSRKPYWDKDIDAYCFDRSQYLFDAILFFYQSGGIISKPEYIDDDVFQEELRFFGIIKDKQTSHGKTNGNFEIRKFLWLLTNSPSTSTWSKLFAIFSTITIVVSTITYCLETALIDFYETKYDGKKPNIKDESKLIISDYFFVCETIYVTWFALEYILRILGHPKKREYILSILGLVDLLAVVPYFVLVSKTINKCDVTKRTVKFLQIFRILKISRFNQSLQLLGQSLYYCKGQISLLLLFFFINCLACGSILYWVERSIDSHSTTSLMDTIWFCIISMTTVGYGDIVPRTSLGKLMAAITILVGIIVLFHIFIPVYLSYFALLYEISILQTLETSEEASDANSQEQDEYKMHRRKSIASSVKKSYASIGRTSSVCINETVTRKQSVNVTEDTVMRRFKYDYLRKISSIESPLTTSQKSLEISDASIIHLGKTVCDQLSTSKSFNLREENCGAEMQIDISSSNSPDLKTQIKMKGRRKAVYEQPTIIQRPMAHEKHHDERKIRSFSLSAPNHLVQEEKFRKFSLNHKNDGQSNQKHNIAGWYVKKYT